MPRYIDADELIQKIDDGNKSLLTSALAMTVIKMIDDTPTADVVEIVRCKDCKFSVDYYNDGDCYCKIPTREMVWLGNNWNGYCSYGERKEVKNDERFNQQTGCD